ncbi:hypothetical protein OAP39_00640 [Flavobacteriaceae bacterium]|jgi:hypothetical protein|nr:hypothetical protein [Flavobacteriaceae bacterium]
MKNYSIIKLSTMWSTNGLKNDVERLLNQKNAQGYEIVSVAFGVNLWWMPTAFITIRK